MTTRIRLDQMLVEKGLSSSRARARDSILRGCVKVNGVCAQKRVKGCPQKASSQLKIKRNLMFLALP